MVLATRDADMSADKPQQFCICCFNHRMQSTAFWAWHYWTQKGNAFLEVTSCSQLDCCYCYCPSSVLNRKAPRFSETLMKVYQTTRRHITGGWNLYSRRPEKQNLKKQKSIFWTSTIVPTSQNWQFWISYCCLLHFLRFGERERERGGGSYKDVANC